MVTGAQVERVVRRFDRVLVTLENEAITALRTSLNQSAIALEAELKRLYLRALEGTASAGAPIREAQARMLLEQVRAMQLTLDASRGLPVETVLARLQAGAGSAGSQQAMALLGLYEQGVATLQGALNVDAILAATRVSSRLTEIGAARVANGGARLLQHTEAASRVIEQHVIDGVTRGQGWTVTARNIRKEVKLLNYEAERIVRTESMTASADARHTRYLESGVTKARWISTLDERTCFYCAYRSGRLYDLDDIILPAHPQCRCQSLPWRPDWAAAGIDNPEWYEEHRREALKKAEEGGHRPTYGPSPGERWAGRTEAPRPVTP